MKYKKILPLAKSPVMGYLCNAYPLSVVMQHEKSQAWFYSNYIQLICAGNFPEGKFMSFYTTHLPWYDFILACPLLDYQKINYEFTDKYEGGLKSFIMDSINLGQYVHLYVDESYLVDKEAYGGEPFPHEMLIHGYDIENEVFHISGFDKNTVFGNSTISFDEFDIAYSKCDKEKYNRKKIYLIKFNSSIDYNFDIKLVIRSFKEYVNSENSSFHYRSLSTPSNWTYGYKVYDEVKNYLKDIIGKSEEELDIRLFHTFWEHKKVMRERIIYMEKEGYLGLDSNKYIDKYIEIEELTIVLRNLSIKYELASNKLILDSMLVMIDKIMDKEKEVLQELIIQLENNWSNTEERVLADHYL